MKKTLSLDLSSGKKELNLKDELIIVDPLKKILISKY